MLRSIAFLIIGLAFGGGLGFVLGGNRDGLEQGPPPVQMDHATMDHSQMHMVPAGPTAPTLDLVLLPDADTGWNLNVRTKNFTFAAGSAGDAHVDGQGHAHLYVNGVKRARVYGDWFHLDTLPPGEVDIRVDLNTNDHRAIAVGGEMLSKSVRVTVPR